MASTALMSLAIMLINASIAELLILEAEKAEGRLRNPDIQILGHPQSRVYDKREGLRADWNRVFAEAAKLNKAVEIDGYSDRQDLRVSLLKKARKEGYRISLGGELQLAQRPCI